MEYKQCLNDVFAVFRIPCFLLFFLKGLSIHRCFFETATSLSFAASPGLKGIAFLFYYFFFPLFLLCF